MKKYYGLIRDIAIIALSVALAVFLARTNALDRWVEYAENGRIFTAFIAGMLFVWIFTAAPAMAILLKIFASGSMMDVVLAAALGSVVGDIVIFKLVKDEIGKFIVFGLRRVGQSATISFFRKPFMRWVERLLGAVLIMSPFPDELGIALMGASRLTTRQFIILIFILDFAGLLVIALSVR